MACRAVRLAGAARPRSRTATRDPATRNWSAYVGATFRWPEQESHTGHRLVVGRVDGDDRDGAVAGLALELRAGVAHDDRSQRTVDVHVVTDEWLRGKIVGRRIPSHE